MEKPTQITCSLCSLCETRTQVVVSKLKRSDIVFVGEAPDKEEDLEGRCFIGTAGKLLRKTAKKEIGIKLGSNSVFLNSVSCRPPGDRNPTKIESEMCNNWLRLNVAMIQPKIIVAVGRFAALSFLKQPCIEYGKMYKEKHFKKIWRKKRYNFVVIPIWHPGYVKKNRNIAMKYWIEQIKYFKKIAERRGCYGF